MSMKNFLIIGSDGQLGTDLSEDLKSRTDINISTLNHSQVELTSKDSVFNSITSLSPDVVINCAAYVRVDDCEDNAEKAIEVNALGSGYVAQAAEEVGAECVYISTDYVFDGEKESPYIESDLCYPLNIYGVSKLSGEHMVKSYSTKNFIIRSSGLYGLAGSSGKGGNFVNTLINLAKQGKQLNVVDDQILTPTFTQDLSRSILDLISTSQYGTYHITNGGECSWFEFTKRILSITGLSAELNPISSEEYGAKARRPAYSVLSNSKLESIGFNMLRPWDEALENYISLQK